MKAGFRTRLLAVALSFVMVLLGTSIGEVAMAHNFEAIRSITLARRPTGKVNRGKRVRFFGRVRSTERSCVNKELVLLVRIGSGVVSSDLTDGAGFYSMRIRVWKTGRYVARVGGKGSGVHPHRHVCFGDRSNVRKVRVRR